MKGWRIEEKQTTQKVEQEEWHKSQIVRVNAITMTKPQLRRDNTLRKLKTKVLDCPEDESKEKDQSWTSQSSIRTGKKTVDEIRTPKSYSNINQQ